MRDLGTRTFSALAWGGGGAVLRILLQFGVQVALARILGPEQYGLFAIGAIVVGFSGFISDAGIAYGLIQKREVSPEDLRFVATWQLMTGTIVTILIVLASSDIAGFFGDHRAGPVVSVLAVICLINALAAPSLNLLKRRLDFRRIQLVMIIAYIAGFMLVGIPLALAGMQVWALVTAWIVQSAVTLAGYYMHVRHPVKPLVWFAEATAMLRYGMTVLATNLVNWAIGNIDRVVIARYFTSKDVGLYTTSYNMLYNPTSSLLGVVQPVFFSASVQVADDRARVTRAYLGLLGCVATFVLPAFAGLSAVANTFVVALYGEAWREAAKLLAPIALAMPLFLAWGLTTPLVWAGGQPTREWKIQLPLALLWVAVTMAAAQVSPAAVAWTVAGMYCIRFGSILFYAARLVGITAAQLWRETRGGLLSAAVCGGTLAALDQWATGAGMVPIGRLCAEVIAGALILATMLSVVPGMLGGETAVMVAKAGAKAPRAVAAAIQRFLLRQKP